MKERGTKETTLKTEKTSHPPSTILSSFKTMKSLLPRITATTVLFPRTLTSNFCPLHLRWNSSSTAIRNSFASIRMSRNQPKKKNSSSLSSSSKSCWIGRPFESSSFHRNSDNMDEETLSNSAVPADIKLYQCDPTKIYHEKKQLYEDLFQQRVTNPDDLRRIESRTIYHDVHNPTPESTSTIMEGHHAVDVTIFWPSPPPSQPDATTTTNNNGNKNRVPIKGVCLHCHGGGWLWGDSKYQAAPRLLNLSSKLNIAIVSVEYRVGPTNRHPAAVDDVETVASWLLHHKEELCGKMPPSPPCSCALLASGESAGAHLLMLAILRLLRKQKIRPKEHNLSFFQCLNLVYGVYDLSGTPSVLADEDQSAPISGKELQWLCDLYLPLPEDTGKQSLPPLSTRSPHISPMYADLKGMPPALFTVGTSDPLIDDTLFMAARYGAAGCHAELAVFHGGQHGLGHFGLQENIALGKNARNNTEDFLDRFLD